LGQKPKILKEASYSNSKRLSGAAGQQLEQKRKKRKETLGVDIFVEFNGNVEDLHKKLSRLGSRELPLTMIANRGVGVWPRKMPETFCTDTWRCRFMAKEKGSPVTKKQIAALIQRFAEEDIDFVQTEHLCSFDGEKGYTVAQDEQ
jgi:isocitrate dehydrogenase